jgi:hypothetical protein
MANIDDNVKPRGRKETAEYSENQYLAKIKRIPPISEEEARELLARLGGETSGTQGELDTRTKPTHGSGDRPRGLGKGETQGTL